MVILFYIFCLDEYYNELIHKYCGLIIIDCFFNVIMIIYKIINEGDIMSNFNQQHFYDDKSEAEKRKAEFYAFNQLINADPFSIEGRDIIDVISDMIPKEFVNMRYTISFYKSFVDKSNNESNEQYKNATASYEKIIKKVNILAKELNLSNSLELSLLFSYLLYNGYFP